MPCEKCGGESDTLGEYQFYYGNDAGSSEIHNGPVTTTTFTSNIVTTPITAFLCDDCVFKSRIKTVAKGALYAFIAAIIGFTFASFTAAISSTLTAFINIIFTIIVIVFSVIALVYLFKSKDIVGDEALIDLTGRALKARGYDKFLTRDSYKDMV